MVPKSLSIWVQRSGRAGRSGSPGTAILLVEPSVFQMRKSAGKKSTGRQSQETSADAQVVAIKEEETDGLRDSDDEDSEQGQDGLAQDASEDVATEDGPKLHDPDTRYWKKVENGLRNWIDPNGCDCSCRREVSREYFNNPPSQSGELSGT
jgi:superfamily II DNA/RNA helicase